MPSARPLPWSLLVGVVHAVGVLVVALDLGYTVESGAYPVLGVGWRYGGLVLVAALPVWLALRHRLVVPLVALVSTTDYVVGMVNATVWALGFCFLGLVLLAGVVEDGLRRLRQRSAT